jgi:hypothetical protein
MSFWVIGSSKRRPISRLMAKKVRIGDALPLGGLTDQTLAIRGEGDDRRRGTRAFSVLDDLGGRAFHHCDAGVGRAQIDADYFSHFYSSQTGMES